MMACTACCCHITQHLIVLAVTTAAEIYLELIVISSGNSASNRCVFVPSYCNTQHAYTQPGCVRKYAVQLVVTKYISCHM